MDAEGIGTPVSEAATREDIGAGTGAPLQMLWAFPMLPGSIGQANVCMIGPSRNATSAGNGDAATSMESMTSKQTDSALRIQRKLVG